MFKLSLLSAKTFCNGYISAACDVIYSDCFTQALNSNESVCFDILAKI